MASFRSEAEAFSGMSGMVEGHARRATGLKPRALARGVGSFILKEGEVKINPSASRPLSTPIFVGGAIASTSELPRSKLRGI